MWKLLLLPVILLPFLAIVTEDEILQSEQPDIIHRRSHIQINDVDEGVVESSITYSASGSAIEEGTWVYFSWSVTNTGDAQYSLRVLYDVSGISTSKSLSGTGTVWATNSGIMIIGGAGIT